MASVYNRTVGDWKEIFQPSPFFFGIIFGVMVVYTNAYKITIHTVTNRWPYLDKQQFTNLYLDDMKILMSIFFSLQKKHAKFV